MIKSSKSIEFWDSLPEVCTTVATASVRCFYLTGLNALPRSTLILVGNPTYNAAQHVTKASQKASTVWVLRKVLALKLVSRSATRSVAFFSIQWRLQQLHDWKQCQIVEVILGIFPEAHCRFIRCAGPQDFGKKTSSRFVSLFWSSRYIMAWNSSGYGCLKCLCNFISSSLVNIMCLEFQVT